uniref:Immunoglobulin V-set domain-containing protein n=1 Tax=Oryzias melastigma TaxID=30732 RepID=A0A3B3E072_ORYME
MEEYAASERKENETSDDLDDHKEMFERKCLLKLLDCILCSELHYSETLLSAASGDDVILPCRLDSEEDLQDFTVEWTKLEMNPDPADTNGHKGVVYLYRSRRTMTKFMMETFIQRVSLNPDGLKRGDVTLKIRNVTLQDEGKYIFFFFFNRCSPTWPL